LYTADKLSNEDRETIVEIARDALAPFRLKTEAAGKSENTTEIEGEI
jgi:hypothetical protein